MGTLKLRFTGLCAFVLNDDVKATQARVLLVDALKGHVEHRPVLVFFAASLAERSARQPDGHFTDGAENRMAFCNLEDQDLGLVGASARSLNVVGQGNHSECPSSSNREEFAWLAPMHIINRPRDAPASRLWGKVDERCLGVPPIAKSATSRVAVTDGTLRSYVQATDDEENVVRWRFQVDAFGEPIEHIQALTEEVELTFPFRGDVVSFSGTTGIHGLISRPLDPLSLKVNASNIVQAWVENMPWDDIIKRKYDEGRLLSASFVVGKEGKRDPDLHFRHFFDLVDGPKTGRVPFPEDKRCANAGQPSVDNPKCPPVQLSANPNA